MPIINHKSILQTSKNSKKMANKKIELVAPAGNSEKMKYAFSYGADAVYGGIPAFSLRTRINGFNEKNLLDAIAYAHQIKKKFYVTLNIYAHNRHLQKAQRHLKFLQKISPDGVIVSDPGILLLVKKYLPKTKIHLSTQANTLNWQAAKFWQKQGVKRIILARETTLKEIQEISQKNPSLELEYFVHGAMCLSYSGRCLLSSWFSKRSANLGDCSQPCRWQYFPSFQSSPSQLTLADSKKELQMKLEEDQHGTYFLNSQDLNLLSFLDDLQKAGVTSFKIEGRNKSVYYLAIVTRAYHKVLDALKEETSPAKIKKLIYQQQKELKKLENRGYCTGFLFKKNPLCQTQKAAQKSLYQFVGELIDFSQKNLLKIMPHNALFPKEKIELITPQKNYSLKIVKIFDENKDLVSSAHGGQKKIYFLEIEPPLEKIRYWERGILRKKILSKK